MKFDLEELVAGVFLDVYATVFGMQMKVDRSGSAPLGGDPNIAGSVGFFGDMTGVAYIYSPVSFARRVTARMAGLDETEFVTDEMVNDFVGENTNRVMSAVRAKLSERGVNCVLTAPSIVRGSNFVLDPEIDAERAVCSFINEARQTVVMEILIKPSEPKV